MAEIHESAIVYPGTILGEGVKVLEGAVVGKQPTLSPRSTAKREPLPPAEIGDGTIVSTGAIVFAGTTVGARVILGDQSCVRERVTIGDDVVLGRGSLIENDTTVGALTKIQAGLDTDQPGRNAETHGSGERDQQHELADQPDRRTGLNRAHRASVSARYGDNTGNTISRFTPGARVNWRGEAAAGED